MKDDRKLVETCLQGDIEAFAVLVERYRYAIYGLCSSFTHDFDEAEDLAQEAFIAAFLELRQLARPGQFRFWLKRIAIHKCQMWKRRQRRSVSLSEAPETATARPSHEEELVGQEVRQVVLDAIGRLPAAQQQVVIMFYLEDMALRQIADFLEISLPATKQRLYRARLDLKETLLHRVEEILGEQKLADDFTEQVVEAALAQGRQLLKERRWAEARVAFRRLAERVAGHLGVQRGLGLALRGEIVEEMIVEEEKPYDERLVAEAFEALEEAYRLGARDAETVWALADLYGYFKPGRQVPFLQGYAREMADPVQAFRVAWRIADRYAGFQRDFERAFAQHRRALAIDGIAVEERLSSYFRYMPWTYFEVGQAESWLAETGALYRKLGLPLTEGHVQYHLDRVFLLRKMGAHREALQTGQVFLGNLEREEVDDPLQRWCWMGDIWGSMLQCYYALDDDAGMARVLKQAQENLRLYESKWRAAVAREREADGQRAEQEQGYRYRLSDALQHLGCACREVGYLDEAEALLRRAQEMKETCLRYMFLSALRLQRGDREGGLEILRYVYRGWREWFLAGYARLHFYEDRGFAPVRGDAEFVELIEGGLSTET